MELVAITILGVEYKISCETDKKESLIKAANLLDGKLTELRASGRMSVEQAAIMAGLHLANDFIDTEKKLNTIEQTVSKELNALNSSLDKAVSEL